MSGSPSRLWLDLDITDEIAVAIRSFKATVGSLGDTLDRQGPWMSLAIGACRRANHKSDR